MSDQKDLGWEDIRKQPAYQAGDRMRNNISGSENAKHAAENMRAEYQKLNKVDRQLFRHGWCDR